MDQPLLERDDSLENSNENPLQFGFENIVFEMDNRCDDQKAREPARICSLAQFIEGNDIARQSFKVCNNSNQLLKLENSYTYSLDFPPYKMWMKFAHLQHRQNEQSHSNKKRIRDRDAQLFYGKNFSISVHIAQITFVRQRRIKFIFDLFIF